MRKLAQKITTTPHEELQSTIVFIPVVYVVNLQGIAQLVFGLILPISFR